jgi:hypothetical protein
MEVVMRRILLIVLTLIVLVPPAAAQSPHTFGVKGGLNYFNIYGGDVEMATYRTGFAIGAAYAYAFNGTFALQPELYYSLKGSTSEEDSDVKLGLGYLDIPILLKVMFPVESDKWAPGIYAGPYLALMMSADLDGVDIKDEFNTTDYGLVVGALFDFMVSGGKQTVTLDVRYSVGFAKLDELQMQDIYNNGFQFLIGYGFSM